MIHILFLCWWFTALQCESSQLHYPRQSIELCYAVQENLYPFLLAKTSSRLRTPPPTLISSEFQPRGLEQSWQETIDSEFSGRDATEVQSTSEFQFSYIDSTPHSSLLSSMLQLVQTSYELFPFSSHTYPTLFHISHTCDSSFPHLPHPVSYFSHLRLTVPTLTPPCFIFPTLMTHCSHTDSTMTCPPLLCFYYIYG